MSSENAFWQSAVQGIIIASTFAFVVLLIATRNIVQSLLSMFCVLIIIASVVTIMVLQGWQLGVTECVCVVMIIGFSVDFVIHLSSDYMHSAFKERRLRTQ
jgi:protein dispatched 1